MVKKNVIVYQNHDIVAFHSNGVVNNLENNQILLKNISNLNQMCIIEFQLKKIMKINIGHKTPAL